MHKIELLAEKCWIIRSVRVKPGETEPKSITYFEAGNISNKSPAHATIFQNYSAAEAQIACHKQYMKLLGMKGWFDGTEEFFDVVSYLDEITHSKVGIRIEIKDGKIIRKD